MAKILNNISIDNHRNVWQDGGCQQGRDQVDAVVVKDSESTDVDDVDTGNFDDGLRLGVEAGILKSQKNYFSQIFIQD